MTADKISNELDELAAAKRERDAQRRAEQEAAQKKLNQVRAKFIEVRDTIIRPALEEMVTALSNHGIEGRISIGEHDDIRFDIIEPDLDRSYVQFGPPNVRFSFDGKSVSVYEQTMGGSKGSGSSGAAGTLGLDAVTTDDVKERVMKVVRYLLK